MVYAVYINFGGAWLCHSTYYLKRDAQRKAANLARKHQFEVWVRPLTIMG